MHPTWHNWDMKNKRVLVRSDLNISLNNDIVPFRFTASLPTIRFLHERGAQVTIITHIGRPQQASEHLSTKGLINLFATEFNQVEYASNIEMALAIQKDPSVKLIIFENLRFFPGEKNKSSSFAQELGRLGDFFVQDAFGSIHNQDTSITLLPNYFSPHTRSIGSLIEREVAYIDLLRSYSSEDITFLLGGQKVDSKLEYIPLLTAKAHQILLSPSLCFPFMQHSQNRTIGFSEKTDSWSICKSTMDQAHKNNCEIKLPYDFIIYEENKLKNVDVLRKNHIGLQFGKKTTQEWSKLIKNQRILIVNGIAGVSDIPKSFQPFFDLIKGFKHRLIITGGNSVELAQRHRIAGHTHYSTGGGSFLHYFCHQTAPGLAPFN